MASFGKVLDLLDERYLHLQDVKGNVEPLPSLVSYENYTENILVYRMDTNHEIFMGLLHEFTIEKSKELSQELWTWFVQWEVDTDHATAPTPKKMRLDNTKLNTPPKEDQMQHRDPIIDIFERCVLDPNLFEEEEMLRCLIDIVQVESSIVPNYIEFLYRWVDFYAGDGKALKAALKWEIPSLWDFEHHPLLFPDELKKANERHKMMEAEERKLMLAGARQAGHNGKATMTETDEEMAGASPKMKREKPDLAAMERKTEESERLQYREVKYGIQPPKLDTPIPPLINIPRNPLKRQKYYAACYRSRQRALVILLEAGLTLKQIGGYKKLQTEDVHETPTDGVPDDTRQIHGMRHYHKDADAAQEYLQKKQNLQSDREKQSEIATTDHLAAQVQSAAQNNAAAGRTDGPLIPPTPAYDRRPDMAAEMLDRIKAMRGQVEERINFVPAPLVGLMKAKIFEDAKDSRLMKEPNNLGQSLLQQFQGLVPREEEEVQSDSGSDEEMGSEIESDYGSERENDSDHSSDDDDDEASPGASSASDSASSQASEDAYTTGAPLQAAFSHGAFYAPATANLVPRPSQPPFLGSQPNSTRYLTPEEVHQFTQQLRQITRQNTAGHPAPETARHTVPTPEDPFSAAGLPGFGPPLPSHMRGMGMSYSVGSYASAGVPSSSSHPPSAFLPTPPVPGLPISTSATSGSHHPMLPSTPFTSLAVRPSSFATPSTTGTSTQLPGQQHRQYQMQSGAFATSPYHPPPGFTLPPHQRSQQTTQGSAVLSGPPQITRTTQVIRPNAPMAQLPPLPQLPARPLLPNQTVPSSSRPNIPTLPGNLAPTLATQMPSGPGPGSGLCLPPPGPAPLMSFENFLSMQQQRAAQAQGQARPNPMAPTMSRQPTAGQVQQVGSTTNPPRPVPEPSATSLQSRPVPPSITISAPPPHPGPPSTSTLLGPGLISRPSLHTPSRTLQRNTAPSPLTLAPPPPPPSPFTSLAPSLLCTTPFRTSHPSRVPILIYFPRIVIPGLPRAFPFGDNESHATDALMLGYMNDDNNTKDGGDEIELSKTLILSSGAWTNVIGKVQRKKWKVMETYMSPVQKPISAHPFFQFATQPKNIPGNNSPHHAAYIKLHHTFQFILDSAPSPRQREDNLTKRWRATRGPMKWRDRGAVWEGYGLVINKVIGMRGEERKGALVLGKRSEEDERRMREMEELMAEEEEMGMDYDWDD